MKRMAPSRETPALDSPFWRRLFSTPRFSRRDWLWTLLPAAAWGAGVHFRAAWIALRCTTNAASCESAGINAIDRLATSLELGFADGLSYWLQNASIVAGFVVPLAIALASSQAMRARLQQAAQDILLWGQTAIWNGCLMEVVRLLVQRPRPFVLKDPVGLGTDAAHYTSFYSGHTSFVAATWTALLVIAITRRTRPAVILLTLGAWAALPAMTGYFRILAGRHYFSDTWVGWFAGCCIAFLVAWFHRSPSRSR